jgi:hypothetical protein
MLREECQLCGYTEEEATSIAKVERPIKGRCSTQRSVMNNEYAWKRKHKRRQNNEEKPQTESKRKTVTVIFTMTITSHRKVEVNT